MSSPVSVSLKPSLGRKAPKYLRVRESVRKRIIDQSWPVGSQLPALGQLLKMYKASDRTVLRALGDLEREGLIVRRKGSGTYVADTQRPPLIPGRILKLGLLWGNAFQADSLSDGYRGLITNGALKEWQMDDVVPDRPNPGWGKPTGATWRQKERGLTIECLAEAEQTPSGHPPIKLIRSRNFDGLMTVGIVDKAWLERLLKLGLPTVVVDYPHEEAHPSYDQVFMDPSIGYGQAIRALLKKGHRRIHFLGMLHWKRSPSETITWDEWHRVRSEQNIDPDSLLRLSAFRRAMDLLRISVPEKSIHFALCSEPRTEVLAKELLQWPEEERPDAIVGHSADQVEWVIKAFAKAGLNLEGAAASAEPHAGPNADKVKWIRADLKQMGAVAADLLVARLRKPERPYLNVGVKTYFEEAE